MLLSACVSSGGGDAIRPLASSISRDAYVARVTVTEAPSTARPEFKTVFADRSAQKLRTCAHGSRPLWLNVAVSEFHQSNGAKAYLLGDANRIKAVAKLIDPDTGAVLGDFDINRSVGGGGLLPAIAMSHGQEQMADAFADELCKRAFVAR